MLEDLFINSEENKEGLLEMLKAGKWELNPLIYYEFVLFLM